MSILSSSLILSLARINLDLTCCMLDRETEENHDWAGIQVPLLIGVYPWASPLKSASMLTFLNTEDTCRD